MAGDDTPRSAPSDRNLSGYSDEAILARWRALAEHLRQVRVEYAQAYLRAKIRKESDGTAHQIAIEATADKASKLEADLDIIKAIWYRRGRETQ